MVNEKGGFGSYEDRYFKVLLPATVKIYLSDSAREYSVQELFDLAAQALRGGKLKDARIGTYNMPGCLHIELEKEEDD